MIPTLVGICWRVIDCNLVHFFEIDLSVSIVNMNLNNCFSLNELYYIIEVVKKIYLE